MGTLLVAHDAGGAEVLSSWALRQDRAEFSYLVEEPATGIFAGKLGEEARRSRVNRVPPGTDFILCGSSGRATLERDLTRQAVKGGIRCAVWLDHWKNYRQRFDVLPDEVWVTDRWAKDLAERDLLDVRVIIKGNPYLEDVLAAVRGLGYKREKMEHVLFAYEPNRRIEYGLWLRRYFRSGQLLRERPHPSEGPAERSLAEDIAWADVVVGHDSMALAVDLRAARRAVAVLRKGEEPSIPYPGLERLYV